MCRHKMHCFDYGMNRHFELSTTQLAAQLVVVKNTMKMRRILAFQDHFSAKQ